MPSLFYRLAASLFICLYIPFSLQLSIFPAMGLKRIYVWPGSSWSTMQAGQEYNYALKALGTTRAGKTVQIDLESMFEYIGGGHRPSLLIFMEPLFSKAGDYVAIKDQFSQYVVSSYNKQIAAEDDKVKFLDLYLTSWPKNRENKREPLYTALAHSWKP